MGIYTEHWKAHVRASKRNALGMLLFVGIGLPGTAVIAYLVGLVNPDYRDVTQIALVAAWLVLFIVLLARANRIVCPRCSTTFAQGKWQRQCPSCALAILQEDP